MSVPPGTSLRKNTLNYLNSYIIGSYTQVNTELSSLFVKKTRQE